MCGRLLCETVCLPLWRDVRFELITSVISAKVRVNRPSFNKLFCSKVRNIPARDHSVFVSCWAFSCSSLEQVLGRTYTHTHGESSGFFCVWALPRAQDRKSPEATQCFCSTVQVHYTFLIPEDSISGGVVFVWIRGTS